MTHDDSGNEVCRVSFGIVYDPCKVRLWSILCFMYVVLSCLQAAVAKIYMSKDRPDYTTVYR